MNRVITVLVLGVLLGACSSVTQVSLPETKLMTPADAAQLAATAKFVVNEPVSGVAKGSEQPGGQYLAAIGSYLKSGLMESDRISMDGKDALSIDVEITEWRMRRGATREIFGVLAGKDGIVSHVTVRDPSGLVLGTLQVETANITSFGGEAVVKMHGEEIANKILENLKSIEAAGN